MMSRIFYRKICIIFWLILNFLSFSVIKCKVFEKCELAKELLANNVPYGQISDWLCIAQHGANYNTTSVNLKYAKFGGNAYYGIFQIGDQYGCLPTSSICGLKSCNYLMDDFIADDIKCLTTIYSAYKSAIGDGFSGWPVYTKKCKNIQNKITFDECFENEIETRRKVFQTAIKPVRRSSISKVYERCELARELRDIHGLPIDQIGTWVCIAKHESNYNTSAVGHLNWDGSGDHGLFQISDIYWCSPPGKGWVCSLSCDKLEDSDISDDIECMQKIFSEHQRLSGDGFNAWAVYRPHCQGRSESYVKGCFDDDENLVSQRPKPSITATTTHKYGLKTFGKVYERCELAYDLYYKFGIPIDQIPIWICIAHRESNYNTSAVGHLNWDGSGDHGLFQISDIYWCSLQGKGKACGLSCSELEDDDITDDVNCIKMIHEEHTRLSGDGFNAWAVYKSYCQGQSTHYTDGCNLPFESGPKPVVPSPGITSPTKKIKTKTRPKTFGKGKVYEKCELARELYYDHNIPMDQVGTWVCIAKYESNYNTSAIGRLNADGSEDHGLFQISDIYWCSPPGKGWVCGLSCDKLEDNDIADDLDCMKKIYDEHTGLSGDGFNAWSVYRQHCKGKGDQFIQGCFDDDNAITVKRPQTSIEIKPFKSKTFGKVYERCELAYDLYYKFGISIDQIPTWICIAHRESNYNTSAVGHLNWDGSGDHGLFQISDIYWCSLQGKGKACGLSCSELEDDDITDDVNCIKMIHEEHTRLSGDGFNAWAVYKPYCQGQSAHYTDGCNLPFESGPKPVVPRPGITSPTKKIKTKTRPKTYGKGKVYEKCELARELYYDHNIPMDQVGTWVCIAKYESNYNTSAIGRLNADGSEDHGLFQISDIYWCSPPGKGWVCGLSCDKLEDSDISDDLDCMKKIYEEHTGLSGDGFNAWSVYRPHCKGKGDQFIKGCFDTTYEDTTKRRPTIKPKSPQKTPKGKGKVYERCELAEELLYKYKLPIDQIATWVCIAHRESNYNTSAVGHLNWDGSEDHGLFQISDIYWCSPPGKGWACGLTCAQLEDSDISDDVECIKIIHEEHTRLSGDGFNAWTVYNSYCKRNVNRYLEGCFQPKIHASSIETTRQISSRTTKKYVTINRKTTTASSIFYTTENPKITQKVITSTKKSTSLSTTKPWATWFIPSKSTSKTTKVTQTTKKNTPYTTKSWISSSEIPLILKDSTTTNKPLKSNTKSSLKTLPTQKPWNAWTNPTKDIKITTKLKSEATERPFKTFVTQKNLKDSVKTEKSTLNPHINTSIHTTIKSSQTKPLSKKVTTTKSSTKNENSTGSLKSTKSVQDTKTTAITRKSSSSQKHIPVTLAPSTMKKTTSLFDFYLESFGKPKTIPTFKPFTFKQNNNTTAKTPNNQAFQAYFDKYFN